MPRAIDHINRALYLIGASSPIKPATAEVIDMALSVYNEMVARWVDQGIEVGVLQAEVPGAQVQNYQWAAPAIQYNLAVELAVLLQLDAGPAVIMRAAELFEEMRRRVRLCAVIPGRSSMDGRLPRGSGNVRGRRYAARFYGDPTDGDRAMDDVEQPPVPDPSPGHVIPRQKVAFPMLSRVAALPQAVTVLGNVIVQDVTLATFINDQTTPPGTGAQVVERYRICNSNGTANPNGDHIMYLDDNVTQQNFSGTLELWVEEII